MQINRFIKSIAEHELCWWINPSNDERTNVLRGEEMFQQISSQYEHFGWIDPKYPNVRMNSLVKLPPCRREVGRLIMPVIKTREVFEVMTEYNQNCIGLMADVTADVWGLISPTEEMSEAAQINSVESRHYWSEPENLEGCMQALTMATVITTPWEELVPALKSETGRPVVYLPDCHNVVTFTGNFRRRVMPYLINAIPRNRDSSDH